MDVIKNGAHVGPKNMSFSKQVLSRPDTYYDLIISKVSQLPAKERNLLQFENFNMRNCLGAASAIIMNIGLKRSLLLYEGALASATAVSITAFGSHCGMGKLLIEYPMFSDPSFCTTCATIRGSFSQAVSSTILPIGVAIGANAIVADRYTAMHIPTLSWSNRKEAFTFWAQKLKPTKHWFLISLGLQSLIGAYFTYRQSNIVEKLHSSVTEEEMEALATSDMINFQSVMKYSR